MTETLRVALVQMSCSADKQANLDKAARFIAQAADAGANIVCLQELFATPYPCQSEDHDRFAWAEPIPGPSTESIAALAAKHKLAIVGSFFERRAAGLYHNTAVLFDANGQTAGVYRKMHIPDDPLYYEKFYFTPGDLGFSAFDAALENSKPSDAAARAKIGMLICWDQWYPEAARLTALAGAEIIFYPTAIGWLHEEKQSHGPSQHSAWEAMMRSHAIANGVFIAAPNRVGVEGGVEFWGGSFIADPYGNVIAKASHDAEEVLIAECDTSLINTARTHWPFLRDRRIDAYADLAKRWRD